VLEQARTWGLTNRRSRPLTSQAIGMLLDNQLYAGIVDVPEYGVRGKRGDFEPLISEELFYRLQSVLSGRVPITTRSGGRTATSHCAHLCAASPGDAAHRRERRKVAVSAALASCCGTLRVEGSKLAHTRGFTEPKLVRRQDQARLRVATARHPSPAFMSEGWWTRPGSNR
jgi:hypothetical protein